MSRANNHLLVMAGGTGGHVFPALAVATALREKGTRITWLGTRRGLESKVVPANEIDIHWISVEGLRGKSWISWLKAPFSLIRAVWQSLRALRLLKPDCVLGMGGFVAGPGGLAAWLLGTPLIVHEQNAVAGLTNKYLARLSKRVLSGFPKVIGLPNSTEWIGNPVREQIFADESASIKPVNESLNILVIGGSQGAHSFNTHLPRIFAQQSEQLNIWHQSGGGRASAVELAYAKTNADENSNNSIRVSDFIDNMADAYRWADVLVCRAGAMTIAELCAAAKPSLLIPFPHSAGDHQEFNAQYLVDAGAAKMIKNSALAGQNASNIFAAMIADRNQLREMGAAANKMHKPDALTNAVSICEEYLHA